MSRPIVESGLFFATGQIEWVELVLTADGERFLERFRELRGTAGAASTKQQIFMEEIRRAHELSDRI